MHYFDSAQREAPPSVSTGIDVESDNLSLLVDPEGGGVDITCEIDGREGAFR
jgi:hypothetical protein